MFLRNVVKFEVDLSQGERESVGDSRVFEITEFEIARFNCTCTKPTATYDFAVPAFWIWKVFYILCHRQSGMSYSVLKLYIQRNNYLSTLKIFLPIALLVRHYGIQYIADMHCFEFTDYIHIAYCKCDR